MFVKKDLFFSVIIGESWRLGKTVFKGMSSFEKMLATVKYLRPKGRKKIMVSSAIKFVGLGGQPCTAA